LIDLEKSQFDGVIFSGTILDGVRQPILP